MEPGMIIHPLVREVVYQPTVPSPPAAILHIFM